MPTQPPDNGEFDDFLGRWQEFQRTHEQQRTLTDLLAFGQLLSGWQTLNQIAAAYERQVASGYNVFGIYKHFFRDENRLHSPFLADLLNTKGSHRQGDLFYRAFLELAGIPTPDFLPTDSYFFNVTPQFWTGDGLIDILIHYRDPNRSFAIAIENKIYARDQDRQLERYHDYLRLTYPKNFRLVYLTPRGCKPEPTGNTISTERWDTLIDTITLIGYHGTIDKLLAATIPQIQAPNVRFIVEQYAEVIGWI